LTAFRYRGRRTRRPWQTGLILTAFALFAVVFVVASGATVGASNFEGNDANLVVNTAGNHDWDNAPHLSTAQDLASGQGDNSFGQGAKEDNVDTTVVNGSIPNSKADLARFAVAGETIGPDSYIYLAWSRENQSGTVNFDFELNALAQPDLTTPGSKHLNRSVNDLLINYSFQGGAQNPTLTRYIWNGSAWGPAVPISSTCSEGAVNSSPVSENLGGRTAVIRPAAQFGEAAINLTCAEVVPPNTCEPFTSAYVKSRSSTAFNSEIKDFIAPISIGLSNCGSLTIIKHTNPRGLDQVFSYTTSGSGVSDFTLNDAGNSGGGDSAGNTKTFTGLNAGLKTITEGADPSGFSFASLTCVDSGGNSSTTSGRVASVTVAGGGSTTCTYVNDQQLGAIKVLKSSIKGQALAGATFSIAGQSVTTGADGTACVDHLAFGNYNVQETAAPPGYSIDDSSVHVVAVSVNQDCSGISAAQALQFNDTPLTDITATAHSEAPGGTSSDITCVDASNTGVGNSPQSGENPAVAANGLAPGTYTCTIVVDP
jgi:prealbumin domain-containing protein